MFPAQSALVSAALKEIARSGPDGFSLREVARRAGVSPPAVYRHFADKDALLAAVAAECWERIGAAMQAAVAAAPDDALERFRATGIAYVTFAVEHPEHFRALAVPGLFDKMPADVMARVNAWGASQRGSLARAQERGDVARAGALGVALLGEARAIGRPDHAALRRNERGRGGDAVREPAARGARRLDVPRLVLALIKVWALEARSVRRSA